MGLRRLVLVGSAAIVIAIGVACGSSDDGGGATTTEPDGSVGPDGSVSNPDGESSDDSAMGTDAPLPDPVCVSKKVGSANPPCKGSMRKLGDRSYCVNIPASATGKAAPLVVLLHGYSANGQAQSAYFDMDESAERYGFVLAKPDGKTNSLGAKYWNASPACCAPPNDPTDDVAYISSIVEDLKTAATIDAKRIYAVGHSNGGFMAHRLACERSNVFAAIVSLAGMVDPDHCSPTDKISVLQVHGDADTTIQYNGGTAPGFTSPYPSVDTTLSTWATKNGCTGQRASKGTTLDLVCNDSSTKLPGSETTSESYEGCPAGIDVSLDRIKGGSHIPDFITPTWSETIMKFLFAHPKP